MKNVLASKLKRLKYRVFCFPVSIKTNENNDNKIKVEEEIGGARAAREHRAGPMNGDRCRATNPHAERHFTRLG